MSFTTRPLIDSDAEASRQLGWEAFGVPSTQPTETATITSLGQHSYGTFDGDTLAARMVDRQWDSYFGGGLVATSGIAGVTVAAEYRGRGLLTPLFEETLSQAKQRGALISTLFPTAPRIYRKFGYEVVADFVTVQVPTSVLGTVKAPADVVVRRAVAADHESIRSVYDAWASAQNGPLSRRDQASEGSAEDYLGEFTGVTLAIDDQGTVCGYASWDRGQGYGEKAALEVRDLLATGAAGYRALLASLGNFSSVTLTTKIGTSGDDVVRTFLPTLDWQVVGSSPYMLKILDVCGALAARSYPTFVQAELAFRLEGDFLGENNGGYSLLLSDGGAGCVPAEVDGPTFTPQGLALLYAGTQSCANIRAAGHLVGASDDDEGWDSLFGGRQQHIRDYF